MSYTQDCTLSTDLMKEIMAHGLDIMPEMIRIVINQAMQLERQAYLKADPYERTAERRDYANGFKPKTVVTRLGDVTFEVPQVRGGGFYPQALDKGLRSERAFKLALAEMYVQGVSTRKVAAITETLCGVAVSSSQVSQAAAELDKQLTAWRNRPLGHYHYLYLDARYEKVRQDGQVRDAAVLVAVGVDDTGKREVLGVSVALSEQEVHWRAFLQSLTQRGLHGLELIISDAHAGLQQARRAVFGSTPWQRCQFHLQQNAQAYVPRKDLQSEVAADIRAVFNAPNRAEADRLLKLTVERYSPVAAKLATWLEENLPQGLTVFSFPAQQRRRLRTTNGVERLNREIRRRTRVVSIFPDEAACLRLVTAILMETSEEWLTGPAYLAGKS